MGGLELGKSYYYLSSTDYDYLYTNFHDDGLETVMDTIISLCTAYSEDGVTYYVISAEHMNEDYVVELKAEGISLGYFSFVYSSQYGNLIN